jgi:hypothetical protein
MTVEITKNCALNSALRVGKYLKFENFKNLALVFYDASIGEKF